MQTTKTITLTRKDGTTEVVRGFRSVKALVKRLGREYTKQFESARVN